MPFHRFIVARLAALPTVGTTAKGAIYISTVVQAIDFTQVWGEKVFHGLQQQARDVRQSTSIY